MSAEFTFETVMKRMNQQLLEELKQLDSFQEDLAKYLETHTIVVEFVKANGDLRKMRCTRNLSLIPEKLWPDISLGGSSRTRGTTIPAFDLDLGEWRSFNTSSIESIDWSGPSYKEVN